MEAQASEIAGLPCPILIGDVGGTNARFAILPDSMSEPTGFPAASNAGFSSLEETIRRTVLDKSSVRPKSAILAVAGMVSGDEIELTNRGWLIDPRNMLERLRLDQIVVLNDFEAQALAVSALRPGDMEQIGGGGATPGASCVVMGPGTGLGVAGLIRAGRVWIPVAGEGGHIDIGPRTPREVEVFSRLRETGRRISAETVLSGRGLTNLYSAIGSADGSKGGPVEPARISEAALRGDDPAAVETLSLFAVLLGRLCGDMALIFKAGGGVYLTGGIARKILPALRTGAFRAAFEDKEPHRAYLAGIPLKAVTHPLAALVGIAAFARNPGAFGIRTEGRHWRATMAAAKTVHVAARP